MISLIMRLFFTLSLLIFLTAPVAAQEPQHEEFLKPSVLEDTIHFVQEQLKEQIKDEAPPPVVQPEPAPVPQPAPVKEAQEIPHNWVRLGFGVLYALALWAAVYLLSKHQ